jgi:hypothetical protein
MPDSGPTTGAASPTHVDPVPPGETSASNGSVAYLPIAVGPPPILFEDDFEAGVGKWRPFVNYWRLDAQQWFPDPTQGYEGSKAYTHQYNRGHCCAHDALTMYLGPGSGEWTDYRYSVRFRVQNGRQAGIWFRGAYQDSETTGQWLTGYYFTVVTRAEGAHPARLWQLRTEEETGGETFPEYWYHFSNPLMLREVEIATEVNFGEWHQLTVEAQGPRFKCYVDDELVFDYTDTVGSIFLKGTVGLYTFGSDPYDAIINFDDVLVEPLSGP